jgi:hypothetical protein
MKFKEGEQVLFMYLHALTVIIWLMWSVSLFPNVITLSGFHFIVEHSSLHLFHEIQGRRTSFIYLPFSYFRASPLCAYTMTSHRLLMVLLAAIKTGRFSNVENRKVDHGKVKNREFDNCKAITSKIFIIMLKYFWSWKVFHLFYS